MFQVTLVALGGDALYKSETGSSRVQQGHNLYDIVLDLKYGPWGRHPSTPVSADELWGLKTEQRTNTYI